MWLPDNLFLLQEYLPHDPEQGIVRLEFLGGELLYAMRVKTHGRFNLCPSPVCNPDEGDGACEVPAHEAVDAAPVEFFPYPDVPRDAVETATRIVRAARLDVGGIEYLETDDGRRVFYDINANSNLRPSVAAAFGFDPFERVVDFLVGQLPRSSSQRRQCGSYSGPAEAGRHDGSRNSLTLVGAGFSRPRRRDTGSHPLDRESGQRIRAGLLMLQVAVDRQHRDAVHDRPDEVGELQRIVPPHQARLLLRDERSRRAPGTHRTLPAPAPDRARRSAMNPPNITR